jgi:hypothetical protein
MNDDVEAGGPISPPRRGKSARWKVIAAVVAVVVCAPVVVGGWLLLGWFVKGTADASAGGKTPSAAVRGVFNALSPWADADAFHVLAYVCHERSGELRDRVRKIRGEVASVKGADLTLTRFIETPTDGGVRVSVMVVAVMPVPGDGGLSSHSEPREWRFDTVGGGESWKVCGFEAPEICEVYLRCGSVPVGLGPLAGAGVGVRRDPGDHDF